MRGSNIYLRDGGMQKSSFLGPFAVFWLWSLLVKFVNGFATNKMCFCMCVCLRVCGHAFLFISFPRQNDDFNFLTCFALCVSCKCGVSFTLP